MVSCYRLKNTVLIQNDFRYRMSRLWSYKNVSVNAQAGFCPGLLLESCIFCTFLCVECYILFLFCGKSEIHKKKQIFICSYPCFRIIYNDYIFLKDIILKEL